jgi:hypothetical protein
MTIDEQLRNSEHSFSTVGRSGNVRQNGVIHLNVSFNTCDQEQIIILKGKIAIFYFHKDLFLSMGTHQFTRLEPSLRL